MAFTDLQGTRVRLELIKPAALAALHELLQDEEWFQGLAFMEPPSEAKLKDLLAEHALTVWEIYPAKSRDRIGFFGYAHHLGTAFIFNVYPNPDFAVLTDCVITTLPAFFGNSLESRLLIHVNRALHDKAGPILNAAGCRRLDANEPRWNPKSYISYVVTRTDFERAGDLLARLG